MKKSRRLGGASRRLRWNKTSVVSAEAVWVEPVGELEMLPDDSNCSWNSIFLWRLGESHAVSPVADLVGPWEQLRELGVQHQDVASGDFAVDVDDEIFTAVSPSHPEWAAIRDAWRRFGIAGGRLLESSSRGVQLFRL